MISSLGQVEISAASAMVSAFSAAIALVAALSVFWFARANLKRELLNQRITAVSARSKYFEDFKKWADEVVYVMTEAIHLCELDPKRVAGESFFDRRHRLLIALSTLIDKGRWFFPNILVNDYGAEKELGYRGYRHELLDGIADAYSSMRKIDFRNLDNNNSIRSALTGAKRHFVGQVQQVLDPTTQLAELGRIHAEIGHSKAVREKS